MAQMRAGKRWHGVSRERAPNLILDRVQRLRWGLDGGERYYNYQKNGLYFINLCIVRIATSHTCLVGNESQDRQHRVCLTTSTSWRALASPLQRLRACKTKRARKPSETFRRAQRCAPLRAEASQGERWG